MKLAWPQIAATDSLSRSHRKLPIERLADVAIFIPKGSFLFLDLDGFNRGMRYLGQDVSGARKHKCGGRSVIGSG